MKKIKWKVLGFVCWILSTMLLLNIGLKAVSQPDTATNILGVISITLWITEEPEVIDLEWLRRKIHEICKVPYHKNDKFNN